MYVEFDVDTITAGDYSVCFDLEEDTYENFKKKYYDATNPMCENAQFKLYLWNELEYRLNQMDDLGYRDEDELAKLKEETGKTDIKGIA